MSHVYNLGPPEDPTEYLHRAGRAGRIGSPVGGTLKVKVVLIAFLSIVVTDAKLTFCLKTCQDGFNAEYGSSKVLQTSPLPGGTVNRVRAVANNNVAMPI